MISFTELEEVKDTVTECADLTQGMMMVVQETGCGGENGLFNIEKQLRNLSATLEKYMKRGERG